MLFDWTEERIQSTGVSEVTELSDLDAGFGNYLARSLAKFKTSSAKQRDRAVKSFFERPTSEQLFIGEYEEPRRFLRALIGSSQARLSERSKKQVESIKERINKRALPIVYFYRNRGVRPLDSSIDINLKGAISNELGIADIFNVEVDYTVMILAFDTATLDRLTNAFLSTFQMDDVNFQTHTILDGHKAFLDSRIADPRLIEFTDASESSAESRLLAHRATITVRSEMMRLNLVKRSEVTYRAQELKVLR